MPALWLVESSKSIAAGIRAVSLLDILFYPDPQLRRTAAEVSNVDGELVTLVDNMFETMYDAPGIGLAATQVNNHQRVVVIDVSEENNTPLTFINPQIVHSEGLGEMQEACLPIPGAYETVKRLSEVRIAALDREGNPFEMDADVLLSGCIQHESDHVAGKMFVAYLS